MSNREWPDPRFVTSNGHHGDREAEVLPCSGDSWERRPNESARAYEAFPLYLQMGAERSTAKVGQELGKSKELMDRWSSKYSWVRRAAAADTREAQQIHERLLASKAKLEEQVVNAALDATDLPPLSAEDKTHMTIIERAALLRTGAGIATRPSGVDPSVQHLFAPDTSAPPTFTIQVIRPGCDADGNRMVGVQLPDGRYGYIPANRVDEAAADHPDWVFIR